MIKKTDKEIAAKARERARRQNQAAKDYWDCVSCRLPKGTKQRIQAQGYAVNGFINNVVLAELERLESQKSPEVESSEKCPF